MITKAKNKSESIVKPLHKKLTPSEKKRALLKRYFMPPNKGRAITKAEFTGVEEE
jgi:hypothetical protein